MRNFWRKWGRSIVVSVVLYIAHLTVEGVIVNYVLIKAGFIQWTA